MKKLLIVLLIAFGFLVPVFAFAQMNTQQGGTGVSGVSAGSILFGSVPNIRMATSSGLQWSNALQRLTATYASTTALTISGTGFFGTASTSNLTVSGIQSAILVTNSTGVVAAYGGASCTNQFPRSQSALGAWTCATVGAADVSLANLTATDSTLTFSGTYNGSTARTIGINLANPNTWTGLQQFANATSTLFTSDNNTWLLKTAGSLGIASTSPFYKVGIGTGSASTSVLVAEYTFGSPNIATSTAATIDCRTSNQQHWRLGSAATTLTLVGVAPGTKCIVVIENPNGTAGALTWAAGAGSILLWPGGTLPTQTTTANKQDVWSFLGSTGSSTQVILGAQSANF